MNGAFEHPLRVATRLLWLAGEIAYAAIAFIPRVRFRSGSSALATRARWLQTGCRRALRIFELQIRTHGTVPARGLLVCNHLSYLDVLVLCALTPSVFVAKSEVRNWPVFGWFARMGGTLFADRGRRTQVGPLTCYLRAALDQGVVVVLFPEGTSSDGRTVLPFKSALLEPAANGSHPVSAAFIEYRLEDGDVGEEVCYWKDMTFVPHLFNLLSKGRIEAAVRFSESEGGIGDRKELARRLHSEVMTLKEVRRSPASPAKVHHCCEVCD